MASYLVTDLESEARLLSVCRLVPRWEHHKNGSNRSGGGRSTGWLEDLGMESEILPHV